VYVHKVKWDSDRSSVGRWSVVNIHTSYTDLIYSSFATLGTIRDQDHIPLLTVSMSRQYIPANFLYHLRTAQKVTPAVEHRRRWLPLLIKTLFMTDIARTNQLLAYWQEFSASYM